MASHSIGRATAKCSSVVGSLLEIDQKRRVCASCAIGVDQHDGPSLPMLVLRLRNSVVVVTLAIGAQLSSLRLDSNTPGHVYSAMP